LGGGAGGVGGPTRVVCAGGHQGDKGYNLLATLNRLLTLGSVVRITKG